MRSYYAFVTSVYRMVWNVIQPPAVTHLIFEWIWVTYVAKKIKNVIPIKFLACFTVPSW